MAFNYAPTKLTLPELPRLQGSATPIPRLDIRNNTMRSILDTLGRNLRPVNAFTQSNRMEDALAPTQELGRQFIREALLPDFNQNIFNPFRQQMANRAAASNLSLMGNAGDFVNARTRQVTQPFVDQAQQVTDQFNQLAYKDANDMLRAFYGSQLNF